MPPGSLSSADANTGVLASLGTAPADVLSLFLRLLPVKFFKLLREKGQLRQNNRIYTNAVVIWLMIVQRLSANGALETAVLELLRGLPEEFWPRPCKRLVAGPEGSKTNLSSNTAAYNEARQGLPLTIVEQSADQAFRQLIEQSRSALAVPRREAFFVDGSSLRMAHREALLARYPPGSNQHGESHWPLLRIVVAHDLYSGLAMRPEWGALNGPNAVSEQGLLEQAIDRLPSGCVVLGDANFGVFSVAYAVAKRGHPVVLRLTMARAKHLAEQDSQDGGAAQLVDGIEKRIHWKPSRDDRRSHPELPADACIEGRLMVGQVHPGDGKEPFLLALFTTMDEQPEAVLELYGYRWNIETDLRSLKDTLRLNQLTCTTPEMVAKEINVAMLAYNLVRAVICVAAEKVGLKPRQFSFTRVRNVINTFAPMIAAADDNRQAQQLFEKMMYYVGQAKLPQRTRKRPSYPRAIWPKPQKYPQRKE